MIDLTLLSVLFVTALVCCAMGFRRFVWFMSVGYGYAVAGIAIVALCYGAAMGMMTVPLAIAILVCAAYGLRLGTFLLKRETGNKAYKKLLDSKVGKEPPMFVKVVMWLCMGVIYVAQTAGLHFRMVSRAYDDACLYTGIVIMAVGAVIEALADKQKSEQKAKDPNMVATEGLFRFMRCPNYFGEILFWTGVFVSGLTAYTGMFQWIVAVLGYVCIVAIMLIGAKNMEKGHIARYGDKPEYRAYAEKTPILFPFVALYHLN